MYTVWVRSFIEMVMKVWRFLWKVSLFGFSQKHLEVEARKIKFSPSSYTHSPATLTMEIINVVMQQAEVQLDLFVSVV